MHVVAFLVAEFQPPKLVIPGQRAFHGPAKQTQGIILSSATGNLGVNVSSS